MIKTISHFGAYVIMLKKMFTIPEKMYMYNKELFRQMTNIGVGSLVIIAIISLFIGAVTAVQFAYQLGNSFIPLYYVGYIVRDSMIIELAPTFSCLVLAGKVGSNMASELGSMRISEQIDALEIMGVNTISYLVGPKILASVIIVPVLVIYSASFGIVGGLIASASRGIATETYIKGLHAWFDPFNVTMMIIKSIIFGFILTSVSCYQGYYANGGALDIGAASTRAVVYSSILILVFDYLIASILL
ncbi:MAG: ABC transporter permease [Chitinophagales bacterium]|nr:ABC transporter permease [Bacteroidota bacterium]MCB9043787.1 ABC transporter permease [Chitinophagales bacterium]